MSNYQAIIIVAMTLLLAAYAIAAWYFAEEPPRPKKLTNPVVEDPIVRAYLARMGAVKKRDLCIGCGKLCKHDSMAWDEGKYVCDTCSQKESI